MARDQYYVADDAPTEVLIDAYRYLLSLDIRWLFGLPGFDAARIRAARELQIRGKLRKVDDLVDYSRRQPLQFQGMADTRKAAA
jgi:hypothetical protein